MAYACPVCGEPQVDAEHLANHVAFTAIGGDADHEAWLDANAPDWGQLGQDELAEIVADHAEETEFPVDVEEGSSGGARSHDHDHRQGRGARSQDEDSAMPPTAPTDPADLDGDARDVLAEARELTRQMRADDEGPTADGEEAGSDDSSEDGADAERSDSETQ